MPESKQNTDTPVIFYDGYCNLCSSVVQFVIKHDKKKVFRFSALHSAEGEIIRKLTRNTGEESVILKAGNKIYFKSSAALHILKRLNGVWKLFFALIIVPAVIRDAVYQFIARNRFRWFGKRKSCFIPDDRE